MTDYSPVTVSRQLIEIRNNLQTELGKVLYGQEEAIDQIFASLLSGGHVLLHGLPGLGKTKLASTISTVLGLDFQRIQFTPDLMPADITGTEILSENPETGHKEREFLKGPVFTNVLLADEINRTPPKTQAALLQAMQEKEVSIGRETFKLPAPFLVLATENPIELEGTYTLPEAQLDRFMYAIYLSYPSEEVELDIALGTTNVKEAEVKQVLSPEEILGLQEAVRSVAISQDVARYAVRIVQQTRPDTSSLREVQQYIQYGASPRATQSLILGAKVQALLNSRLHVNFEDIDSCIDAVLRHRLLVNFKARADKVTVDSIIQKITQSVSKH